MNYNTSVNYMNYNNTFLYELTSHFSFYFPSCLFLVSNKSSSSFSDSFKFVQSFCIIRFWSVYIFRWLSIPQIFEKTCAWFWFCSSIFSPLYQFFKRVSKLLFDFFFWNMIYNRHKQWKLWFLTQLNICVYNFQM